MTTLKQLEKKYNNKFPILYKKLFEADMMNWMRGVEQPLKKGTTWANNVYPTLKENPPLLLHSGGFDFELLTPYEILNFSFPEEWDTQTHQFIPFAKDSEGNIYAFYPQVKIDDKIPIVFIWEDDETEYIAKNFEDFIFKKMLESVDDIDKDDLYTDYGKNTPMSLYQKDLKADLKTISPYLKEEFVQILEKTYNAETIETFISYGFKTNRPIKETLQEKLYFDLQGEVFSHEK